FFSYITHYYFFTLSLHDALPILRLKAILICQFIAFCFFNNFTNKKNLIKTASFMIRFCVSVNDAVFNYIISINKVMNSFLINVRSEEHTSELQSRFDLVCSLLLE